MDSITFDFYFSSSTLRKLPGSESYELVKNKKLTGKKHYYKSSTVSLDESNILIYIIPILILIPLYLGFNLYLDEELETDLITTILVTIFYSVVLFLVFFPCVVAYKFCYGQKYTIKVGSGKIIMYSKTPNLPEAIKLITEKELDEV